MLQFVSRLQDNCVKGESIKIEQRIVARKYKSKRNVSEMYFYYASTYVMVSFLSVLTKSV